MSIEIACEALRKRLVLQLRYGGYTRDMEVHAVGYSKTRRPLMRAWQVGGGSASGEKEGWKLIHLDEVKGATILSLPSQAPRRGYKTGDKAMDPVICEVSN